MTAGQSLKSLARSPGHSRAFKRGGRALATRTEMWKILVHISYHKGGFWRASKPVERSLPLEEALPDREIGFWTNYPVRLRSLSAPQHSTTRSPDEFRSGSRPNQPALVRRQLTVFPKSWFYVSCLLTCPAHRGHSNPSSLREEWKFISIYLFYKTVAIYLFCFC